MPPAISVTTKGPMAKRQQYTSLTHRALKLSVQNLVELGEQRLDVMLRPRPGGVYLGVSDTKNPSTGNYRRNIQGQVSGLNGRITDGGVIYGPWLEGTGSRNVSTRFKGYASFRRTGQWMNQQAPKVVQTQISNLVRGLNGGV